MSKDIIITVCLSLFLFTAVYAQPSQQRMAGGGERLETLQKIRMIESLELDEESAVRLAVLYTEYHSKNREHIAKIDELITELEQAVEDDAPDSELRGKRDKIAAERKAINDNRNDLYMSASEFLTDRQMAKLIVFERNFNRDLREVIRGAQRERRQRR